MLEHVEYKSANQVIERQSTCTLRKETLERFYIIVVEKYYPRGKPRRHSSPRDPNP